MYHKIPGRFCDMDLTVHPATPARDTLVVLRFLPDDAEADTVFFYFAGTRAFRSIPEVCAFIVENWEVGRTVDALDAPPSDIAALASLHAESSDCNGKLVVQPAMPCYIGYDWTSNPDCNGLLVSGDPNATPCGPHDPDTDNPDADVTPF